MPRTLVLVTSCLLHAIAIGGAYMCLPPLFEGIVRQEGWTLAHLQRSLAFAPAGSGFVALATGAWLQRHGDRSTVALSGALVVCAVAGRYWIRDPDAFLVSIFIYGIGCGALLVSITNRVARTFVGERAGLAQALFFGAYTIGAAVGLGSAEWLSQWFGNWRAVSLVWAGACALTLLPALATSMPPSGIEPAAQPGGRSPAPYRRRVARYCFIYAVFIGGYLGVVGLMPYQLREWGWAPLHADLAMTLSTAGFLLGSFLLATWTDRRGHRRAVFAASMMLAGLLVAIAVATSRGGSHPGAWAAILAIGFFCGAMALFFPIVMEDPHTGGERAAQAIGFTTAASYAGGFLVPFVFAPYVDAAPIAVLGVYAAAFALAGMGMVVARRPEGPAATSGARPSGGLR